MYCKDERYTKDLEWEYPYPQWYATGEELIEFDPINTNVRSDFFYKPKQVLDGATQIEKWWSTWSFQFTFKQFEVLDSNIK